MKFLWASCCFAHRKRKTRETKTKVPNAWQMVHREKLFWALFLLPLFSTHTVFGQGKVYSLFFTLTLKKMVNNIKGKGCPFFFFLISWNYYSLLCFSSFSFQPFFWFLFQVCVMYILSLHSLGWQDVKISRLFMPYIFSLVHENAHKKRKRVHTRLCILTTSHMDWEWCVCIHILYHDEKCMSGENRVENK